MSKRIAILQSCYIPWKGYFDLIAAVDEFILYDDVQFTKNDWRNRNKIKTPQGVQWLTIPVKKNFGQTIRETEIDGTAWAEKHWKSYVQYYSKAPAFAEVSPVLKPLYECDYKHLIEVNHLSLKEICNFLGIRTVIRPSWDYVLGQGKTERLVDLCRQAGAAEYVSGPSAKSYIVPELFAEAGIKLSWFDYAGYPEYPQLWGEFMHEVSILDMLFNLGRNARNYMKY